MTAHTEAGEKTMKSTVWNSKKKHGARALALLVAAAATGAQAENGKRPGEEIGKVHQGAKLALERDGRDARRVGEHVGDRDKDHDWREHGKHRPKVQVTLDTPTAGSTFVAPATIELGASAGVNLRHWEIVRVEFYANGELLSSSTSPPYGLTWVGVAAGSYTLVAKAYATNPGQAKAHDREHARREKHERERHRPVWVASSEPVQVSVTAKVGKALYFVHADHLNTPRLITDAAQQPVWRWDAAEPFGDSPPDENPSGLGVFEFPLRFGGPQYFDKETGRFHIGARQYSPGEGRFLQADPAGMEGDINPYVYSENAPVDGFDPDGERRFPQKKKGAPNSPQNPAKKTGNCSAAMHSFLQGLVNFWCSKPHHCSPSDSCPENKLKIKVASNCATARRNINQQCYNGGDAGHQIAEEQAKNAVRNCIALQPVCCKP
jgi:RHS repeat-associated protein